jgi:hypothetical protein
VYLHFTLSVGKEGEDVAGILVIKKKKKKERKEGNSPFPF